MKKNLTKKLSLNKATIASLNSASMKAVIGGVETHGPRCNGNLTVGAQCLELTQAGHLTTCFGCPPAK